MATHKTDAISARLHFLAIGAICTEFATAYSWKEPSTWQPEQHALEHIGSSPAWQKEHVRDELLSHLISVWSPIARSRDLDQDFIGLGWATGMRL
jgi:hypothetical protein